MYLQVGFIFYNSKIVHIKTFIGTITIMGDMKTFIGIFKRGKKQRNPNEDEFVKLLDDPNEDNMDDLSE